jgi:uncharacterized repeat protein (TIGR03843 family)
VEQPNEEAGLVARSGAPDDDETPGPDPAVVVGDRDPDGGGEEEEDPGPEPELPPAVDLPPDLALRFLHEGDLEIVGRLVQASNTTLLVRVIGEVPGRGPTTAGAVYKPIRGERPLWDFPEATLAHREVAAHAVSEATGWRIVPPTVFRADGPVGPGMLQLWVETRDDVDILDLLQSGDPRLRRIALFDAVVNNADRKGGHLLVRPDGLIQGVDHGVTFNVDPKLRTILWGWRGTPIAPEELLTLAALRPRLADGGPLSTALAEHLDPAEIKQARVRLDGLLESGTFPQPHPDWPAIPWPWY